MAVKTVFIPKSLITYYLKYKSIDKAAQKYGYSRSSVYRFLKENNVNTQLDISKHRLLNRRFKINDDLFEKIDTRDKAYILGIISSDGHLLKNSKQIRIKLTDIDLLEEIRKRINYNKPLTPSKKYSPSHKEAACLTICNGKIYDDLVKAGIPQQKSFNNVFPKLNNILIKDFIRGFFDGNGSISISNDYLGNPIAGVEIVSTLTFCNSLKNILEQHKITSQVAYHKGHDIRIASVRIRSVESIVRFYFYIYDKITGQIFLKRKHEKYSDYIEQRKNNIGSNHKGVKKYSSLNLTPTW